MTTLHARRLGLTLIAMLAVSSVASAEELPINLQIQLLSKMVTSIPQMQPSGSDPLKIVVVYPGDTVTRGAQSLTNTIKQTGKFGPHDTTVEMMSSGDPVKIAGAKAQIVYLASEVDERGATSIVEAIGAGTSVTVAAASDLPKAGVVLGFSLVEARPRVLVNLKQARKQNIEFKNKFLTFAVIVDK